MTEIINKIHCMDVLDGMKLIPDDSVSLIFSSPPYNTNIEYRSHKDDMTWQNYLDFLKKVWVESKRVLRPGGRLAINIDAITNWDDDRDKEYVRPIYAELVNQMHDIDDMNFRCEIMWCKTGKESKPDTGQVVGRATAWGSYLSCSNPVMRRNHEYILCWSKGEWGLSGDPEQSDMTDAEFQKWTMSTWCVSPEGRKMGGHPVPFPEELVRRVVKLFSYRGDVVLDPFNGSGTTTAVAAMHHRQYIGIDCDDKHCKYARKRTENAASEAEAQEKIMPYEPRSERMAKKSKNKKKDVEEVDMFA